MTDHATHLEAVPDPYCGDSFAREGRSFCIETAGPPGHRIEIAQRVRQEDAYRFVQLWNKEVFTLSPVAARLADLAYSHAGVMTIAALAAEGPATRAIAFVDEVLSAAALNFTNHYSLEDVLLAAVVLARRAGAR